MKLDYYQLVQILTRLSKTSSFTTTEKAILSHLILTMDYTTHTKKHFRDEFVDKGFKAHQFKPAFKKFKELKILAIYKAVKSDTKRTYKINIENLLDAVKYDHSSGQIKPQVESNKTTAQVKYDQVNLSSSSSSISKSFSFSSSDEFFKKVKAKEFNWEELNELPINPDNLCSFDLNRRLLAGNLQDQEEITTEEFEAIWRNQYSNTFKLILAGFFGYNLTTKTLFKRVKELVVEV